MQLNPLHLLLDCWSRSAQNAREKRVLAKENHRQAAIEAWYARLPPVRSVDEPRPDRTNVCTQSDSLFFRKLPLEIRRLIYAELFCEKELLFQVPDENKYWSGDEVGKEKMTFKLTCPAARGLLVFPMSCKRAYMETIEDVYKRNKFRFSTVTSYWCFRRLLHSGNLDLIQRLHLQYSYQQAWSWDLFMFSGLPPYNHATWKNTWEDICSTKGLTHVRVDIRMLDPCLHAEWEDAFFSPLTALRDSVKVEVRVSWKLDYKGPPGKEWPFTLKRHRTYREKVDGLFSLDAEEAGAEPQD